MTPARTPKWMQMLWPSRLWRMPADPVHPTLYLTFDDGPTPGVTNWILDQLDAFEAKASFFAVGQQAEKNPELLREVMHRGHAVGTHTQHHLNGWKTQSPIYLADVESGNKAVSRILTNEYPSYRPTLFRPPYGRLRSRDARQIGNSKIVMWNVLAADWRSDLSVEEVTQRVTKYAKNGSIVVFHDSLKAESRVKGALPNVLKHFAGQGFRFDKLD